MGSTLEVFFTGKFFRIPNYQRDYAWDIGNVDDLIDDIIEAIETSTSHYIGTFILSKTNEKATYNVVDGQQRLTTLIMLFNVAIKELGTDKGNIIYDDKFIKSHTDNKWRLRLLNDNNDFFQQMLAGETPKVQTKSQQLLWAAYDTIRARVRELKSDPTISSQFIDTIKLLNVMEFTESDDGKAIRMFQTVNDRGKPLSNVEKAKSLLVYYSNRFLKGELDDYINEQFGQIFHFFTEIKTIGEQNAIDVISSRRFSEDSIMRYHFLAFAKDSYDLNATESYVLDNYLKLTLKPLRGNEDSLRAYINEYVTDLRTFFESFVRLLRRVPSDKKYYKLFSILGLSARLYPLLIRLETRNLLDPPEAISGKLSLIDIIEIADVRVYKVRGRDLRADVSYLARDAKNCSLDHIKQKLFNFINYFMSDSAFAKKLKDPYIYPNVALKHIFIEYSESFLERSYSLNELIGFNKSVPTVEHIFPREATFRFPNFGFSSIAEYSDINHVLGNLTLLEKSINSQCRNKTPSQKISDGLYGKSSFGDPKKISAHSMNRGSAFTKRDVDERTKKLAEFCMTRWRI